MARISLNPVGPTTTATTSTSKKTSSRKQPNHPSTWDMVKAALLKLKDRNGSSRQALTKYIETNYDVKLTEVYKSVLRRTLAKAVTDGKLLKNKASFKLSPTEKMPVNKIKKPIAKKGTVALKKPATMKKAAVAAAAGTSVKKTKKTATAKSTVKKTTATASAKSPKVGTPPKKRLAKKTVKKSGKSKQK